LTSRGEEIAKVILATGSTLPIAIAVGMTFPFIAAGLMRKSGAEVSLPMLYFTNSLGSAIGILATSYLLIPEIGNHATLCVAASINFLLAAVFSFIGMTTSPVAPKDEDAAEFHDEDYVAEHKLPMPPKNTWFWIAAITGLTSFVYEIVWIRLLSLLLGSSSHSFDQMLSAFILGLALGSAVSGKLLKKDSLIVLSMAQIFMAFFALCTLYFHQPFWGMMNEANQIFNPTSDGYVCWSLFKYALSMLWMIPTSFFAGMTLPLITLILTRAFKSEAPIGKVYGWNTLGSIVGSAGGGLLLLPLLQLKGTLVTAALLDFAIGFLLLVIYRKRFRYSVMFYIMVCVMIMPAVFVKFDPSLITSGVFRSYKNMHPNEKIQVIDGKTATISFHESPVHYYVKTNGKADASMSKNREAPISSDELTQAATAFMPMAVKTEPYDAAMVGFGSGMGAHYLLADPLLKDFDCVEIEQAMMDLAKGFYPWNYRGYDDPRIHIFIDDATTFFHTNRRKYDMIISVPSNPWVSGVAGLFAHEFYAKMRRYMRPGALWVQWIQTYEFNDLMFLNILKALDTVFPYVSLYKSTDEPDIIMIASDEPVIQKGIGRFSTDTALVAEFNRIHRDPEFFGERNFLFTNKMLKSLLEGVKPNSLFIPMVDNKAEEARFVHSEAHIVQVFDSCEVCWQQYLDPEDYALRRPARVKAMLEEPKDEFKKTALLSYMRELEAAAAKDSYSRVLVKVDTVVHGDSVILDSVVSENPRLTELETSVGYQTFREYFVEWIRKVPIECRDSDEVYMKAMDLVSMNAFPRAFADEFGILEAARQGVYKQAALLIANFFDRYEMNDMGDIFLRNCIVLSLLAGEPELADAIYKNVIQKNEDFFAVEKRLIEREIQQLRRKLNTKK
jgi:predicted membrane-bound spermidine synthase